MDEIKHLTHNRNTGTFFIAPIYEPNACLPVRVLLDQARFQKIHDEAQVLPEIRAFKTLSK